MIAQIEAVVSDLAIMGVGLLITAMGIGAIVGAIWLVVWSIRRRFKEQPNERR